MILLFWTLIIALALAWGIADYQRDAQLHKAVAPPAKAAPAKPAAPAETGTRPNPEDAPSAGASGNQDPQ